MVYNFLKEYDFNVQLVDNFLENERLIDYKFNRDFISRVGFVQSSSSVPFLYLKYHSEYLELKKNCYLLSKLS